MSLSSRFPTVFSHHDHLSRAVDRPVAPFMGAPEVEFSRLWRESWTFVRNQLCSKSFVDQIGRYATPLTISTVVEGYIDHGGHFLLQTQPLIETAVIRGGNDAVSRYDHTVRVEKADEHVNPFRDGTPAFFRWRARYGNAAPAIGLDLRSQYASVAKKLTLNMIENITTGQKRRVRDIISKGFVAGERFELLGPHIASVVGLNSRWAQAVENLRAGMEAKNMNPLVINRRCLKYGETLLQKRGVMVARTEMMTAMNAGRYQYWLSQHYDSGGGIEGSAVVKIWVRQAGCCVECADVEDRVVGLETMFRTPYGPRLYGPLHPHCRCTVDYEMVPA